jgi:hypothetical protein
MTHRIRLGPPWDVTASGGRTRHARRFGRPRTLGPGERVWLACGSVPGPADILVNGEPVGSVAGAGPFAADVTPLLKPRNEVVIETASADPPADVALEIRAADSDE